MGRDGPEGRGASGILSPMPLTPAERETMAGRVRSLSRPVRLALYTRAHDCDTCADTRAIVDEVAALSPRLSVEVHDLDTPGVTSGLDHAPVVAVLRDVDGVFTDVGVRLVGAPLEHELT